MLKLFFILLILSPSVSRACASCGCTLSSNWEDADQKGFKFDLRYDYINQDQLRTGLGTITPTAASQIINSNGMPQEVEVYTRNNYVTATGEYTFDPDWKVSLMLPYIFRDHSTLGTNSNGITPGPGGGEYNSSTASFGDAKIFTRFQGFSPQRNWGVLMGLKLPTGSHSLTGTSTDPTAPGTAPIDRGLQPGSGTVDFILGIYTGQALDKNWDYFAEAMYQYALDSVDQFRPGDGFNGSIGLRYMQWEAFLVPQVQINARNVQHDSGAQSDTISTGGTLAYITPGVTIPLSSGVETYGFFQLPIYQNLLGVQLAPTYTVSAGLRYAF